MDPEAGVLRNNLGITDPAELQQAETDFSTLRVWELAMGRRIEGRYDLRLMQKFHAHLFGDVYPWAGEVRTVNIAKQDVFCRARFIADEAERVFRELAVNNNLQGLDRKDYVEGLAELFGDVNALHPFREGNGRTERAFLFQLSSDAGFAIAWSLADPDANYAAGRAAMRGDTKAVRDFLDPLVMPREQVLGTVGITGLAHALELRSAQPERQRSTQSRSAAAQRRSTTGAPPRSTAASKQFPGRRAQDSAVVQARSRQR